MKSLDSTFYPDLVKTIESLHTTSISLERMALLNALIEYLQLKLQANDPINLNFICTHNSRRSHLAQIWAQTLAAYYGLKQVTCYSGGTEATAVFPEVIRTLESSGFQIQRLSKGSNPIYAVKFALNDHPVLAFSKTYDADFNPKFNFAAVMTCGQANENCPLVQGSEQRISLLYDDPKAYDGTTLQEAKYDERSLQIAAELKYVFAQL